VNTAFPQYDGLAEIRSMLKKLAMTRGAHSTTGRVAHNMLEQTEVMQTYVRPEWAVHKCQTLPWLLERQAKLLALSQSRGHHD
jgi:hypothetical protein